MSLNYNTFLTALSNFLVVPITDPDFLSATPNIIDDAEQRIYRDLDLLNSVSADSSGTISPGALGFGIPIPVGGNGPFLVIQQVNVITPVGADPSTGTANPLTPASKEFITYVYPSSSVLGVPRYFAMVTQGIIIVGPRADAAYVVNVIGTIRPAPLSATNTTTLLSLYFPDLLLSAALAMGAGYLKDFGAATDDPQSGVSWEKKYQTQLQSAILEEARKKFQDNGWGSLSTGPKATPPRV